MGRCCGARVCSQQRRWTGYSTRFFLPKAFPDLDPYSNDSLGYPSSSSVHSRIVLLMTCEEKFGNVSP